MTDARNTTAIDGLDSLEDFYRDLHEHPELSLQEHRTAARVADTLRSFGYDVTGQVGVTGVVGVLERGSGATVMLRADMDALPVVEQTGLDYASTTQGVMHACGHDLHTTALVGAAQALASDTEWNGRLILVFQPAEETGAGARAMIADGLVERFGTPDVVLGQHVAPLPAGVIGMRPDVAFAASDALVLTVFGRGGHGSRPETTVDPIVLGAAIVTRLQTVVARETAATDVAVVTVGSFHAGEAPNVIADRAVLQLSVRTFDPRVREHTLAAIERIARGEALAAGAERVPELETLVTFPVVTNDPTAMDRVRQAFARTLPQTMVIDPGVVTGSEDVGILAEAAGAPLAYWVLGGADPALFSNAQSLDEFARVARSVPANHSPLFAPVIEPTLRLGVEALRTAALSWLDHQA